MSRAKNTAELIVKLKAVREEYGYSYNDILNMVEAVGEHTSLSSIRRVFSEGSEDKNFRYEDVIRPISRALLTEIAEPDADNPKQAEEYHAQLEAMYAAAMMKETEIAELTAENEKLKWQIELLEKRQGKSSRLTTMFLGVMSFLFVVISLIDITNGNMGFVRYEVIGIVETLLLLFVLGVGVYMAIQMVKTFKKEE